MCTPAQLPFQPAFIGLAEQIAIHGRFRPREIALVEGGRHLDWETYNARANRVANVLIASGVRAGDRVAMVDEDARDLGPRTLAEGPRRSVLSGGGVVHQHHAAEREERA